MSEATSLSANLADIDPLGQEKDGSWIVRQLADLGETQSGLARQMSRLGDNRPFQSIVRSIQRMASGDARVSGEMCVILEMMIRARRQAIYEASKLSWSPLKNGSVTARTREFTITLWPQTRGRWLVNLVHDGDGYSPPWPEWQPNLEEAKIRALLCIDNALSELQYNLEQNEAG